MSKLAINGGTPVRSQPYPGWPPKDPGYAEALLRVEASGNWCRGVEGPAFTEEFAAFCDARYVVTCCGGTAALELALRAAGVGAGHEVIIPPFTFIATASCCATANAVPVFADVDLDTMCLDPVAVEAAITPSTAAVIGVHIGGMPCDVAGLKAVTDRHGIVLIEDCAQAHGARYAGKSVGAQGKAGCFSFQASKNLTAGEGGALVTNDEALYEWAWSYRDSGRPFEGSRYDHPQLGSNLRMTEFQAALLRHGLTTLPGQMERRDRNALHLRKRLAEIPGISSQAFSPGGERSAWHLFIFRYEPEFFQGLERSRFMEAMQAEGIPVGRGYDPMYRESAFHEGLDRTQLPWSPAVYKGDPGYDEAAERCPASEILGQQAVWLNQSRLLADAPDMDDIAEAIIKVQEHAGEVG